LKKLKLHGFNNLTKSLSFCIYDICYAKTAEERDGYIAYIDELYNANRLTEILSETCSIIGANILNIARQDYEPQGASVTILVSEEPVDPKLIDKTEHPGPLPETVVAHLDKSHICVHTYPESHPEGGLCTFRADIEVSTCGVISPLKALNYLIHQLESDIVTIDYRVRGFTRDINGMKHFIDHEINSIQNFMSEDMKALYDMVDVNVYQENIFHTKMLLKEFDLKHYMFHTKPEDLTDSERQEITAALWKEMREIITGAICQLFNGSGGARRLRQIYLLLLHKIAISRHYLQEVLNAAQRQAFLVVVVHPLFHFIASEFQLIGANHYLFTVHPQGVFMPCPLPGTFAAFERARGVFHFIKQGQVFFYLFIKPVPDHFMPHGHAHLYHSGYIAQKFIIHSVFLCSRQCAEIALRH